MTRYGETNDELQQHSPKLSYSLGVRRWMKWAGITLGVLLLVGVVSAIALHESRPTGEHGAAAEALARRIEVAVNREAWERTGAVQWTFSGYNRHLWDRTRHLHRLERNGLRTLLRLDDQTGRAWRDGAELHGAEAHQALAGAYASFVNDSFWLNPLGKIFDPGTTRAIVHGDAVGESLLVSYGSGGLTPGDAYLWQIGPDGTPTHWRMWVSVIPIGGVGCSWEGWTELETGARISTVHRLGPLSLNLEDVAGAQSLHALVGSDPFAPLFE